MLARPSSMRVRCTSEKITAASSAVSLRRPGRLLPKETRGFALPPRGGLAFYQVGGAYLRRWPTLSRKTRCFNVKHLLPRLQAQIDPRRAPCPEPPKLVEGSLLEGRPKEGFSEVRSTVSWVCPLCKPRSGCREVPAHSPGSGRHASPASAVSALLGPARGGARDHRVRPGGPPPWEGDSWADVACAPRARSSPQPSPHQEYEDRGLGREPEAGMARAPFRRATSQARGTEAPMKPEGPGAPFAGGRAMRSASNPIHRTSQRTCFPRYAV